MTTKWAITLILDAASIGMLTYLLFTSTKRWRGRKGSDMDPFWEKGEKIW